MNVHFLQHVPYEGLGYIQTWLQQQQHTISATKFYERDHFLPPINNLDALIVMGGPMGIDDEQQFPWLAAEKDFINHCITTGKKVLGICLGAQLIAGCLGASVQPAPNKEIGWFPVMPVLHTNNKSWLPELFKEGPVVFHWHGDQFALPQNCVDLLYTTANQHQAFMHTDNIIGLQFHLEVTPVNLEAMLLHGAGELTPLAYIQTAAAIKEQSQVHINHCNRLMGQVLQRWLL